MIECSQCKFWDCSQYIMNKYGEGCGKCIPGGQITFCSHKCTVGVIQDEEENEEDINGINY